jgi:hypothetical protein
MKHLLLYGRGFPAASEGEVTMALQDKLDAFTTQLSGPPYNVPQAVIDTMRRGTAELIASGQAERAMKADDRAPAFILKDSDGQPFKYQEQSDSECPIEEEVGVDQWRCLASGL